ncbi:MAG: hypothetical protein K8R87_09495 [Verrucomicrobia bacterium]|nr:hypothetical protein [Verrucomicrobiota bacterium]
MSAPWSIRLARTLFFTLAVLLGAAIAGGVKQPLWLGMLCGAAAGAFFVLVDALLAKFSFRDFSFSTLGLMTGLFCAWLVTKIGIFELPWFRSHEDSEAIRSIIEVGTYLVFGFLGITLALRSERDQFSFIIPYVRFRRDASEGEPMLLDTNIIIDGRLPGVFATGFLTGNFVIPRFLLDELQRLADSRDEIKSARGRRGLDCVQLLRETRGVDLTVHENGIHHDEPVDTLLVTLARELNARLLTNDVNLGKVAQARGVSVLNFNHLTAALQPELCPGDELDLALVKPGKERHQALGYLPNGTMIVVNHGAQFLGETVAVSASAPAS